MITLLLAIEFATACSCVLGAVVHEVSPSGEIAPTNTQISVFFTIENEEFSVHPDQVRVVLLAGQDPAVTTVIKHVHTSVHGAIAVAVPHEPLRPHTDYQVEVYLKERDERLVGQAGFRTSQGPDEQVPAAPSLSTAVVTAYDTRQAPSCTNYHVIDVAGEVDPTIAFLRFRSNGVGWHAHPRSITGWANGTCSPSPVPTTDLSVVAVDFAGNVSAESAVVQVTHERARWDGEPLGACSTVGSSARLLPFAIFMLLTGMRRRKRCVRGHRAGQ